MPSQVGWLTRLQKLALCDNGIRGARRQTDLRPPLPQSAAADDDDDDDDDDDKTLSCLFHLSTFASDARWQ